jgi:hypothetical protein
MTQDLRSSCHFDERSEEKSLKPALASTGFMDFSPPAAVRNDINGRQLRKSYDIDYPLFTVHRPSETNTHDSPHRPVIGGGLMENLPPAQCAGVLAAARR